MSGLSAMLLAAGRGERLRPLTDRCPKPLLELAGQTLLDRALAKLQAAGIRRCVVNLNWLGEQIEAHLQLHAPAGLETLVSWEREQRLETGGGILQALPLLGPDPFLLLNGDVYSDFPLEKLLPLLRDWPAGRLVHLVLVDNPAQHPEGDFALGADGQLGTAGPRLTYSGIAVVHPALFADCRPGRFPLAPLLRAAIAAGRASGEHYRGWWTDVGTPERLAQLRAALTAR